MNYVISKYPAQSIGPPAYSTSVSEGAAVLGRAIATAAEWGLAKRIVAQEVEIRQTIR